MKRVIIDTDGGADDAMALLLALRSPELQVEAITTVCGNVEVEQATRNVLLTLEVLGGRPHPPVLQGASSPFVQPLRTARDVHGDDGLGNVREGRNADGTPRYPEPQRHRADAWADDFILELVNSHPGEISIITLGPLTNIAHAAELDLEGIRKAKEIIIMGGAFETYGNISLSAEFNIAVDPEAAQSVFALGLPITVAPLDVTHQVLLKKSMLDPYLRGAASPVAQFIADCTETVMAVHAERYGEHGCFMHDPLAVALACDEALTQTVAAHVTIETSGDYTSGQTIADLRPRRTQTQPPNAQVCVSVDAERFFRMFTARLLEG